MGTCFSKKNTHAKTPHVILTQTDPTTSIPHVEEKKLQEEPLKNEIFVVKQRRSHKVERKQEEENGVEDKDVLKGVVGGAQVRSSSCSKEEVDAILIQCGRLSRSSSCELKNGSSNKGKRSCGSKRSFDFENENENENEDHGVAVERGNSPRNRHRSRTPSSPGQGRRRRTPSRERDQGQQQQQRSGANGSGRRVSRSPGRRSESPNTTSNGNSNSSKPQKMVSVPATVSSMAMDKSTNGDGGEGISAAAIKRIQVKRNVGDAGTISRTRTPASPRARSPARNLQSHHSRSNSRVNEQSPYRRNPLGDIDTNVVLEKMPVPGLKTSSNNVMSQESAQKLNGDSETKLSTNVNVVNVIRTESLKPQGVARSRSSRLSRDLDINLEALTNANPTYTSLLLEDIQNFHQKSTATAPTVTLPACVSKAHSILEAVADLNSSSFSENRKRRPLVDTGMRKLEPKESFVKSKVGDEAADDHVHPSICNYVTVRRGSLEGSELEEQESSGSNSVVAGSQQHWVSSSSWEPTSADSTDRWTSRSNKDDEFNPLGFQRQTVPDTGSEMDSTRRRVVVKRKDGDLQQNGIGRGRVGPRYTTPTAASAST